MQEAWKNTAFAYELGKCLVAAKKKERDHLLQEPRCNRFERIVATVLLLRYGLKQVKHTHTLDKNGSLYDPAGTES